MKTSLSRMVKVASLFSLLFTSACGVVGPDGSLLLPKRGQLNYDWDTYPVLYTSK